MSLLQGIKQKFFKNFGTSTFFQNYLTPSSWRRSEYLEQYEGIVHTCISAIAQRTAMIDFFAEKTNADGTELTTKNHELLRLLRNPNDHLSKYQLIEMTVTHLRLTGEAYWYFELGAVTRKPKTIFMLRPDKMTPIVDDSDDIVGWIFTAENGKKVPLEADEVLQFKYPDPKDPKRGIGTVQAAMIYIQTETYASKWTRNFLFNNARPNGVLALDAKVDAAEFQKIKRQWQEEYGSIENAGKTAIIRGAQATFTQVGMGLGDIALKELKNLTRDDIMTMFRVSKPILGIFEDVNLASAKTAHYVFMKEIIDPEMYRIVDTLNNELIERYGDGYQIGYESPVPEDQAEKIEYYKAGIDVWLTTNDIRSAEGLDEMDGGGVIYKPINLVPIGEEPEQQAQAKHVVLKIKTKEFKIEAEQKEMFRIEVYKRQERWQKNMYYLMRKLLNDQMKGILARINGQKKKAFEDWLFDDAAEQKAFTEKMTPLLLELMKEQGQSAFDLLGQEGDFVITEKIKEYVAARTDKFVPEYLTNVKSDLVATLTEGVNAGENIRDLKKRIEKVTIRKKARTPNELREPKRHTQVTRPQ